MDNTDLLVGGSAADLLIGLLSGDVLDGGPSDDILIGGLEGFAAPNSDVLLGGSGNDINIWVPGDGSDLFVGGPGKDVQIFAPIVAQNGKPEIFAFRNRQVPHVSIDNKPLLTCGR